MEEIKKYIDRFFSRKKNWRNCTMYVHEMLAVAEETEVSMFDAISDTFNLGYARCYRAALADRKKKGGAA